MTAIDAITTASATNANTISASTTARAPKQSLDSAAFMSLLVTQLTNQDPSTPMDTNQMIGQTTQLAMMEKLTELASTGTEGFSLQMRVAATSLLGEKVSYLDSSGATATGTATAVSFATGIPRVTVGGVEIALDTIAGIARA